MATRKKRRQRRQKQAEKRKPSPPPATSVEPTDVANPDDLPGVRGLLEDPGHYRGDMKMLGKYLGCGLFSEKEIGQMVHKLKAIAIHSEKERSSMGAVQTLIKQAELMLKIEKQSEPRAPALHQHQHAHVHVEAKTDEDRINSLASELGIDASANSAGVADAS